MNIGNQTGEPVIYVADNGGGGGPDDSIAQALESPNRRWCSADAKTCSGQLTGVEFHESVNTGLEPTTAVTFYRHETDQADPDDYEPFEGPVSAPNSKTLVLTKTGPGAYRIVIS